MKLRVQSYAIYVLNFIYVYDISNDDGGSNTCVW